MARKMNISVLGSYSAPEHEANIAYELGKKLANLSVNVISGGQKGVMLSLCKGISDNRAGSRDCTIVGILPSDGFSKGNEYLDVAIPSGSPGLQNSIVPLSGDIVVAIGGSAGTLTEISIAWQHKKPIALIGETGWASKLRGQSLDNRRDDKLPHFLSVDDLIDWVEARFRCWSTG